MLEVGPARRVSRRLEDELDERSARSHTARFLDVIVDRFPDLAAVSDGGWRAATSAPKKPRRARTMIRIIAGAYHELVLGIAILRYRMTNSEVTAYFSRLAPHMEIPINDDWKNTGLFKESGMARKASQGDVERLADKIADWSKGGRGGGGPRGCRGRRRGHRLTHGSQDPSLPSSQGWDLVRSCQS